LIGRSAPDGSTEGDTATFTGPTRLSVTGIMTLTNGRAAETMPCRGGGSMGGDSVISGTSWVAFAVTARQLLASDCGIGAGIIIG